MPVSDNLTSSAGSPQVSQPAGPQVGGDQAPVGVSAAVPTPASPTPVNVPVAAVSQPPTNPVATPVSPSSDVTTPVPSTPQSSSAGPGANPQEVADATRTDLEQAAKAVEQQVSNLTGTQQTNK